MEYLDIIREAVVRASKLSIGDEIRPFDIILFERGIGSLFKGYTHAAIVVNRTVLPTINEEHEGKLLLWESIISSEFNPDLTDGVPEIGVQLRDLRRSLIENDGGAICKLTENPLDVMPLRVIREKMTRLFEMYDGERVDSGCGRLFRRSPVLRSDFVAVVLKEFGLIDMLPGENVALIRKKWHPPREISIVQLE